MIMGMLKLSNLVLLCGYIEREKNFDIQPDTFTNIALFCAC